MEPDVCIMDGVSEDEVKSTIRMIHILRSVWGDPDYRLQNLARVLEVLYGVEYDEPTEYDFSQMERVLAAISTEDAVRLDPVHVREQKELGDNVLDKFGEYLESGRFRDVELISSDTVEVSQTGE